MTMKTPAISKELDFVARHAAVAGDVYDGTLKVDTTVRALTVVVCDKADSDAERLARQLSEGLSRALHGIIRIDWKKFNVEIWEIKGAVFGGARGRKGKKIGEIGLVVSWYTNETPRLIGWVWSKGGVQGLQMLETAGRAMSPGVCLAKEHPNKYPDWGDCVIWSEVELTKNKVLSDLEAEVSERCRKFCKIAKPLLQKLSAP